MAVSCPICSKSVKSNFINAHIDSSCQSHVVDPATTVPSLSQIPSRTPNPKPAPPAKPAKRTAANFFQTPPPKRQALLSATQPNADGNENFSFTSTPPAACAPDAPLGVKDQPSQLISGEVAGLKRDFASGPGSCEDEDTRQPQEAQVRTRSAAVEPAPKRVKTERSVPLAERMRPRSLDDIAGQDLVGPNGILRSLIETQQVPSMILWGATGTGKTTIARCMAQKVGGRFIELNATSAGVAELKKHFTEAANELALTGRKTFLFCDEIHRFSRTQQDVFLHPVESGTVTLIGATTENPSFKVASALLSRCRVFVLSKLNEESISAILQRALRLEEVATGEATSAFLDDEMLGYLVKFSDGDARTALNLLELALSLTHRKGVTKEVIKHSLTKTLVYDRAGDQHYDTISAFHKSIRGSDADAALYYLARMIQSGEDPLFIARRMVVIASEDIGLADNAMLPLATATFTATQQIGMPEARIPLAHCAVALALAPKSVRAYRALDAVFAALEEPGVASLPVPVHLRNAPTRLMRDLGYGAVYKYPPRYVDGMVQQEYLPSLLIGRRFLDDRDLGTEIDPDLVPAMEEEF